MRTLAIIAIIAGALALAGAAFAHGPGWGGGWGGGHMMAPGYHMNGTWGGHMGQAWAYDNADETYVGPQARAGYGPGYGWCYANPDAMPGWGAPLAPETVPSPEE